MPQLSRAELFKIFGEVLEMDPGKLNEQSAPANVEGWDSAKSMELVVTIEEALDSQFTAEELDEMVSVGTILDVLSQRGALVKR